MNLYTPIQIGEAYARMSLRTRLRILFSCLILLLTGMTVSAQPPVVTVRFANPQFDCVKGEYCLDVEFQSNTPGQEIFGMNIRFFYDDNILELIDFRNFQGGYGPVAPNPPGISTSAPAGPSLFNFAGPAEFVNGAMQKTNSNATPIILSTTGWTKLFQICFRIDDPNLNPNSFCPSIVWDLEQNPVNGGFLIGDDGVVITLVNPDPTQDSSPANENVVQFNWQYIGAGNTTPYGQSNPTVCISTNCNAKLSVVKTGVVDLGPDGVLKAGDVINYAITVINTGFVPVSNILITDPNADPGSISCPSTTLNPGDTMSCTAVHTITQADLDAGGVTNQALATGQDPQGDPVTDESGTAVDNDDPTQTPLQQNPSLYVTKVGVLDLGSDGVPNLGDVINYTIVVTNTGNVTISNITIADPNADAGSINCTPAEAFTLTPGQSATCTAAHTITQADLENRLVVNVATASGQTPGGDPVNQVSDDPGTPEPNDPTVIQLPCVIIETWVYLEGSAVAADGSANYSVPMRTTLNDLRLLPGQTYNDFFLGTQYSPAGQPYSAAPWNYPGNEGNAYDSTGDLNSADAGYPATVTDWVLVSLRTTPDGAGGPVCQAAALLHKDGRVEFVDDFACCDVDLNGSYYLVIEHRNHLIVMSHEPVPVVNGKLAYDFRVRQSYIDDPFLFGTFSGQKEILPGVFAMFGGNGNQTLTTNSDTDINFDDRTYWESENGDIAKYRNGDYNLNGDTNFNDRRVWEFNNGKFTSVPRN